MAPGDDDHVSVAAGTGGITQLVWSRKDPTAVVIYGRPLAP